jgi:hypothetical protein
MSVVACQCAALTRLRRNISAAVFPVGLKPKQTALRIKRSGQRTNYSLRHELSEKVAMRKGSRSGENYHDAPSEQ